jgi:osmoprotectant transport system substrate-binding protein/osmoprotectant transport system permease protein
VRCKALLLASVLGGGLWSQHAAAQAIVIGSKTFTESYLLAEIMAQLLESHGQVVRRQFGFAGTLVCFEALRTGEIDAYAEYSGTIREVILAPGAPRDLGAALAPLGVEPLAEFGFNDTYALAVTAQTASKLHLATISDLREHPDIVIGLSHEFRDRRDGWPGLKERYGLTQQSLGIEHGLAYRALTDGRIEVTDAYSTDADLARYRLVVLRDDLGYFPTYTALPLVRQDVNEAAKRTLSLLAGRLTEDRMRALNAQIVVDGKTFAEVAGGFLQQEGLARAQDQPPTETLGASLAANTLVHLKLTGISLLAACVCGLAIALAVYRSPVLSRGVLYVAGLLQTIPSIALLALLIPVAGVGQVPAIIALFLYSLLPIVRNAITALLTIDPLVRRVATAMGLTHSQQLRYVYMPLALPHVLAGLRIAAVISIGTATLAAFIGAGGLGEPIVTGLALNNTRLILQGAIPAALLALATELGFELLERLLIPPHLSSTRLPV